MMMSMEGYHLAAFNGLRLPPPHPPTCLGKGYAVSNQSVTFRMSGASGGRNLFTDQAFHTPSFGDEDFDLPPLTLPSEQGSGYSGGRASLALAGSLQPDLHPDHPHSAFQPKFPPQNFDVPDITVSNSLSSSMYSGEDVPMSSEQPPLSTISQSQMARQLGFQTAMGGTSPPNSTSTSSPSRESSEDSDDSLPLAQLVSLKRPASNVSPVPSPDHGLAVPQTSSAAKKPKTPKKKKKKDPNEPQKPVSAYALFFRDTQAVIKGQNPNASFGDVSKIVASMWDSLDPDNKNVYKKKTEVAKKEYLKQLAAYRASQVSQSGGGGEDGSSNSDKSPSPQSDGSPSGTSPQASSPLSHPPPGNAMHVQAPLGHPQGGMGGYGTHPVAPGMGHMSMMPGQPGGMGVPVPPHSNSLPFQQPLSQARGEHMLEAGVTASGLCVRAGCSNNAVDNPGWDSEYCSNDCVVRHCRDVFTAWVATRQGASDGFPVK